MSTEEKVGLAVLVAAVVIYFMYESSTPSATVGGAISTVGGVSQTPYAGPSATQDNGAPTPPTATPLKGVPVAQQISMALGGATGTLATLGGSDISKGATGTISGAGISANGTAFVVSRNGKRIPVTVAGPSISYVPAKA